jgi:RND family efflux transporter MFP subunit
MPLRLAPGALGVGDVIQAPYDGTVVTIYERTGAVVSPGQPVLRLVAAHAPWVTVFVEAEDAALLRPGQRLQCRAGGYLSRAWELRVEQVGREAVPRPDLPGSARQVRVRCAVLEPAFPLAPGAEVDVDGSLPVLDSALLLPATAVVHEGEEEWVWLVDEQGAVRRRPVRLGPNNFELIQIREGLQPGETVVVHGKEGLEEGQRVRAVEAEEGARRGEGAGAR